MFEKLKQILGMNKEGPKPETPSETLPKSKPEKKLPPKELATKNNEPYIAITKVEVDPSNINNGAFELDWNDKFILNLIRAGYKLKDKDTDNEIVERWFQHVCRNIALEIYEQEVADPEKRKGESSMRVIQQRDLGNGRTEIS